jgi:hypothetical protein
MAFVSFWTRPLDRVGCFQREGRRDAADRGLTCRGHRQSRRFPWPRSRGAITCPHAGVKKRFLIQNTILFGTWINSNRSRPVTSCPWSRSTTSTRNFVVCLSCPHASLSLYHSTSKAAWCGITTYQSVRKTCVFTFDLGDAMSCLACRSRVRTGIRRTTSEYVLA